MIVDAPNPELKLIPGMTANLTIYTLELNDVMAVPLKALKFQPETPENEEQALPVPQPADTKGKPSIWIVRDGKLVQTPVETGVSNGIYQQIKSGLKSGDKVALQYNLISEKPEKGNAEENPFMPKPPGSEKKKK